MTSHDIIRQYEAGMGTQALARQAGVHRTTIQRILKRGGCLLRKRSPDHPYNVRFFDNPSPGACYWAGFLLADGHVRSDRDTVHIKLGTKDRNHLVKFALTLGLPESVVHDAPTYCFIDVNGPWFPAALDKNFNVTPQKTHTATLPALPVLGWPHMVRGLFDGDGCLTLQNPPQLTFNGTSMVLNTLRERFYSLGVRLKSKNRVPPIHKTGQMSYSGKNARLILNWMYAGSVPSLRLDRKHRRFLQVG